MSNSDKPERSGADSSVSIKHTQFRGEIFQSSYPPPEMLKKYAEIDPTFPDRLLKMAEKEGEHRRTMEKRITGWSIFLDFTGTLFALGAVGAILYVGYLFMKNDNPRSGAAIIGSVAVALAIAFLTRGKRKQQ